MALIGVHPTRIPDRRRPARGESVRRAGDLNLPGGLPPAVGGVAQLPGEAGLLRLKSDWGEAVFDELPSDRGLLRHQDAGDREKERKAGHRAQMADEQKGAVHAGRMSVWRETKNESEVKGLRQRCLALAPS